jgi:hypothetical protein
VGKVFTDDTSSNDAQSPPESVSTRKPFDLHQRRG